MKPANPMDPRMQERRLRTSFLTLVNHLPTRPEPRHIFDNVARASNPLPPKGADLVTIYQSLIAAAVATGKIEIVELTQSEIINYHEEVLAQGLAGSPILSKVSFDDTTCKAIELTSEAVSAIGKAGTTKSPAAIEEAVREAGEAVASLELFRERAANLPRRQHLSLSGR